MTKPSTIQTRLCSDDRWVDALLDPGCPLAFSQCGASRCPEHWTVMERAIAEHLLYFVADHALVGEAGGAPLRVEAGSVCWVMPQVLHRFDLAGRPLLYHLKFRLGDPHEGCLRPRRDLLLHHGVAELRPLLDVVNGEHRSTRPFAPQRQRAALALLCSELLRRPATRPRPAGPGLTPEQRRRIETLADAREDIAPADLAAAMEVAPERFTRLFRESYGSPPRRWLQQRRMQRAARLLSETRDSIGAVAAAVGYQDLFLFSRQFKKAHGMSPSAYRKRSAGVGR